MSAVELMDNKINVKHLITPEVSTNAFFLTPDFELPKDKMDIIKNINIYNLSCLDLKYVKLLFPKLLDLDTQETNNLFSVYRDRYRTLSAVDNDRIGYSYIDTLASAKIAFPQNYQNIDLDVDNKKNSLFGMIKKIEEQVKIGSETMDTFVFYALPYMILFPNMITKTYLDEIWGYVNKNQIKELFNGAKSVDTQADGIDLEYISNCALVFEDFKNEFKNEINSLKINLGAGLDLHKLFMYAVIFNDSSITSEGIKINLKQYTSVKKPLSFPQERSFA